MKLARLESQISIQLLSWSASSVLLGLRFLFAGDFWRGVGLQFIVWGLIDAGIALFGRWQAHKAAKADEARLHSLRRTLLINAGLDVIYIIIGVLVLVFTDTAFARGNAWGVMIQGAFLLGFDVWHGVVSVQRVNFT